MKTITLNHNEVKMLIDGLDALFNRDLVNMFYPTLALRAKLIQAPESEPVSAAESTR